MAAEFNVEAVKACILERGGRIRNHELVTYFKNFLNHPNDKGINREKFKDFVNELATIKVEEGEKILVLKKKHRPESAYSSSSNRSSTVSIDQPSTVSIDQPSPPKAPYQPPRDVSYTSQPDVSRYPSSQPMEQGPIPADAIRARSEPPAGGDVGPREGDRVDGAMMSRIHSDDNLDVRLKSSTRPGDVGPGGQKMHMASSTPSLASAGSQGSLSSATEAVSGSGEEEGGNVSVLSIKEKIQQLNKISSESDVRLHAPRIKKMKDRDDDDESHTSGGTSYVTLTPEEKEWMLVSATAEYQEMYKLLSKNGRLAKVKDIANGLHFTGQPSLANQKL
ncbi:hypothetical protein V1264_000424 [Littorina saxatilis]|uniref:SOWAHA-C winged helix-turn-helix domain-containing protein n=1 Tax=Littorina saxatilis TaxID=31220 RepID=A0AAN9GN20_9CAEN